MQVKDCTFEELVKFLNVHHIPTYRAKQIFGWIYQKNVDNWEEMSDLPKSLRQIFSEQNMQLNALSVESRLKDTDETEKFLFRLDDSEYIESVLLPESDRNTICFSTQVGCGMGCTFCATGKNGFRRNLSTAEIVDQTMQISRLTGARITNLVAMGQGEPLLNYEALIKSLKIMNDSKGLGLGARRMTISTCGIIPGILKLTREGIQLNLAISLHAADNTLRDRLMPINRKYPLEPLIEACREYIEKTSRRITFEYTLIKDINDRDEDLKKLEKLLSGLLCHVNLIPFNPISNSEYTRSGLTRILHFENTLNQHGIETTVRKERGSELTAACGQLKASRLVEIK